MSRRPLLFSPTEHQLQQAYFNWLAVVHPDFFEVATAVPLGQHRELRVGAALKREGLRAGYPDILIDYPVPPFCGLRLELKSAHGRLLPQQQTWLELLAQRGYYAVAAWGLDNAMRATDSYAVGDVPQTHRPIILKDE